MKSEILWIEVEYCTEELGILCHEFTALILVEGAMDLMEAAGMK